MLKKFRVLLTQFIQLLIYGSFIISIGASAMFCQSQLLILGDFKIDNYITFVFFSTFLIYSIHRVQGIIKLNDMIKVDRFALIVFRKNHIIFYGTIALIFTIYLAFQIPLGEILFISIPAFISLFYVVPLPFLDKRLRDYSYIKIFLIAIVWSWISTLFPFWIYTEFNDTQIMILYFLEKVFFVFAITLPFDIRDIEVDALNNTGTIPSKLGKRKTYFIIYFLLVLAVCLAGCLCLFSFYSKPVFIAILLSYILTAFFLILSQRNTHDFYFSGLLDLLLFIQPLLTYIFLI